MKYNQHTECEKCA